MGENGGGAPLRIAVVGGGVAGIVSSYLLSRVHDVTLFERNDYVGGHTRTVVLKDGPDAGLPVDTGFIVLNDITYPLLHEFLRQLKVEVRYSDMSFGFHCDSTKFQYAGTSLDGLFARRRSFFSPAFYRFLWGIKNFCSRAWVAVEDGSAANKTLGEFLDENGVSARVRDDYVIPMAGAIWSSCSGDVLSFPAEMLFRFYRQHGLLAVKDRPRWQTVVGGSHSYVKAFLRQFKGQVRTGAIVRQIARKEDGVVIAVDGEGELTFDRVIVACHADEAFAMLADPSTVESEILGAWRYQLNTGYLHSDESLLPANRRVWASWNYLRARKGSPGDPVQLTYHMNRLQGFTCPREYFVSLNVKRALREDRKVEHLSYSHPVFTTGALASQGRLREISGQRNTYFCGSYHGYGFHEDAVRSAVDVGRRFGINL